MKDNILDFIEDVRDKFSDFSMIQIITAVVVTLCVVISVIGIFGINKSNAEFKAKTQENDTLIMSLKSELAALTSENSRAESPEAVEVVLKSANTAGMAVAGLQTAYQDCYVNAADGSSVVADNLKKNAEALDVYFDDDDKGARVPWFSVTGDNHARLVWSFMTNYTFTSDSVECLWICRDTSNNMVAFALGTYTASTSLFSDVSYYATAYGNKNYRTPDDPIPVYSIDLSDGSNSVLLDPDNVLQPEGYTFDESGKLVDPDGNAYMEDESWAANFEEIFKASKEYRESELAKKKGDA